MCTLNSSKYPARHFLNHFQQSGAFDFTISTEWKYVPFYVLLIFENKRISKKTVNPLCINFPEPVEKNLHCELEYCLDTDAT